MSNLIHRDQYSEIWRQEGMSERVIADISRKYEYLPANFVKAMATDDGKAGIGWIQLGTGDFIKIHDWETLADKEGFPIKSIAEVNLGFLGRALESSAKHLYLAPRDLVFGVVGSVVGAGIMIYRALN